MKWGIQSSHVAGAGGVGVLAAGKAEAQAAGALWLAVQLALHSDGAAAVGHARAPAHQRVVLPQRTAAISADKLISEHDFEYGKHPPTMYGPMMDP